MSRAFRAVPAIMGVFFFVGSALADGAPATVKTVNTANRTIMLRGRGKAVAYPWNRLIILPRPDSMPPAFEKDEPVEIERDGRYFVLRRLALLEIEDAAALLKLPEEKRDAIVRARAAYARAMEAAAKPSLDLTNLRTGDIGKLDAQLRIVQILSDSKLQVAIGESRPHLVIEGVSTFDLADDELVAFRGPFRVLGTRRYITLLGARKTVFALEPYRPEEPSIEDSSQAARFRQAVNARAAEEIRDQKKTLEAVESARAGAEKKAPSRQEATAAVRLRLAKRLTSESSRPEMLERLEDIVKDFPGTKAADEAAKILADAKRAPKKK
jgi:hypothetical protein